MRTLQDVITDLEDYIQSRNLKVNAKQEGKVVKDIVVDSPSQEFAWFDG